MRYFLDTEYNGFGGALISLALVPEHGDQEFYAVLPLGDPVHPWVERHVLPYLASVPPGLMQELGREEAALALAEFLRGDPQPRIVADWPEDIAHLCMLLMTGPGRMVPLAPLDFGLLALTGFSPAANSAVPHNALHDARALRAHVVEAEARDGRWV